LVAEIDSEPEAEEYEKAERTEPWLHKISARDSGSPYRGAWYGDALLTDLFQRRRIV